MELKHRLILTTMIGLGGAIWAALLGFGVPVVIAVAIGSILPVWFMSRTSALEPNRRTHSSPTILEELEAGRSRLSTDPYESASTSGISGSRPTDVDDLDRVYVLTRARNLSVFSRRGSDRRSEQSQR